MQILDGLRALQVILADNAAAGGGTNNDLHKATQALPGKIIKNLRARFNGLM